VDGAPLDREVAGLPVEGWDEVGLDRFAGLTVALGIGAAEARASSADRISAAGGAVPTLVHSGAVISPSAVLGRGAVVMAGVVVNADASVGAGAVLNTGCIVEHDCTIGDYALVGPNAALGGGVQVGNFSVIGVGAAVRPGVHIGSRAIVGAGSGVVSDVGDGQVVGGVPARPLARSRSAAAIAPKR
jgi:sugar O-acyltransferase (sialic acid O-acetyltransferase NeuD family)